MENKLAILMGCHIDGMLTKMGSEMTSPSRTAELRKPVPKISGTAVKCTQDRIKPMIAPMLGKREAW